MEIPLMRKYRPPVLTISGCGILNKTPISMKPTTQYPLVNHPNILSTPTREIFLLPKKYFKNLGTIGNKSQKNITTKFLCIQKDSIISLFCAEPGTFCSKNRQICTPKEQFNQSPINPNYRNLSRCGGIIALSYYRINYTTKLTQFQIS